MNENEKKAILYFRKLSESVFLGEEGKDYIRIILELIDKYEKKLEDVRFERDKALERVIYRCDPNKNKTCNKKACYINNGPCDATFKPKNASFVCLEDFIPKAVLRDTLDKHIVITDNTRYYNADSKQIINDIEKLLEE